MVLNLVQTYQTRCYILPFGYIDKEMYWQVFMKTDDSYRNLFFQPLIKTNTDFHFTNDFEHNTWGNNSNVTTTLAHSGNQSAMVDSSLPYSPTFNIETGKLPASPTPGIYVQLWAYVKHFSTSASLVINISGSDSKSYYYQAYPLTSSIDETGCWHEIQAYWDLPAFKSPADILSVYIWCPKGIIYIDDIDINFGDKIPMGEKEIKPSL